jgi:uncharacterized protein YacL
VFVEIVRLFIVLLATLGGYAAGKSADGSHYTGAAALGGMLGCLLGYVGGGVFGRVLERALGIVERSASRLPAPQFLAAVAGGALGGMAGAVMAAPVAALVPSPTGWLLGGLLVFVAAWLGLRIAIRKSEELLALAGLSTRPLVRTTPFGASDGAVVDTSAAMDGQLLPLARAGLLDGDLFVPRFVLDELRGLADAGDETRARRARAGLEILDVLTRETGVRVRVLDDELPEFAEVDAKIVALAKRLELRLITTDSHLARSAGVQGVPACNLRQLAADLWPARKPGDVLSLALVRPGKEPGQGVGYLDDGSMVVVAGGEPHVGRGVITVTVTSVVPTSVGRVVFATMAAATSSAPDPNPHPAQTSTH